MHGQQENHEDSADILAKTGLHLLILTHCEGPSPVFLINPDPYSDTAPSDKKRLLT